MVPRRIVIHATAGTDSLAWLTQTSDPPVSVHRLIARDGTIFKLVADDDVAYHVGFSTLFPYPNRGLISANYTSLGIELENTNTGQQPYPKVQLAAAMAQIIEWYGAYGYLPLVGHCDLDARKLDPVGFAWEEFMGVLFGSLTHFID